MNALAPIALLAFLAIALVARESQTPRPLARRRKAPKNAVVPFDVVTQNGGDVVEQNLLELAGEASQKLGRPITPDTFALAAMIASEEGGGTAAMKTAVAWAAKNRALRRNRSLAELLAPGGVLASQSVGKRYAATDEPPSADEIVLADKVIRNLVSDPTGGADQFDSPAAQRALLTRNHPRYKSTPEQVEADRRKQGKTLVTLPGVSPNRLRFWRPKSVGPQTPSATSGDSPTAVARKLRDAGAPEKAFALLAGTKPEWSAEDIVTFLAFSPSTLGDQEDDYEEEIVDGIAGHDETYDEAVAGKVVKEKIPTVPVPKLVEALASKWGKIWGVPKSFIQTIASVESSNVPAKTNMSDRAIKLGGAWGLMMVTYASGRDLARQAKASPQAKEWTEIKRVLKEKWHDDGANLLDPELNVMLGSYFLSRLFKEFKDIDKVAAGYHAGAGGVRSAIRKGGPNWQHYLGPYSRTYISMAEAAYPKFA